MSSGSGIAPSWQTERLGSLAQVKGGKRLPKGEKLLSEPTPFPYIRVCDFDAFSVDLSDIHYLTSEIQEKISRYIITKEDVFISIAGTIGRVGTIPESLDGANLTENAARVVLESDGSLDKEFLKYCLASPELQSDIASRRSKNAQPKLALAQIKDLEIPLPPLPEQKNIAYFLSTVQRAIEAQERIIQTTTELKKALMHKLFTEGLRNEPQKQTEIGPIPENWEVVRFADSVSIKNGQVDPRQEPFDEMLHVGSENIESDTGRLLDVQTNRNLKISSGNYHFTSEDVLYSKIRPYLNKVALPEFAGTCSADMYPLRSSSYFTREFLFYCLLSDGFKKAAMSFQDRTGIPKINRAQLGSIQLACPSKEEQSEIVTVVLACDAKRNVAQRKQETLQDLFRTLLHELMTAKTRVDAVELSLGTS